MGRITFGDIAISGILTLILILVVATITSLVISVALGLSGDLGTAIFLITLSAVFLGGGVLMGVWSSRAGYPVLRTWAWGSGIIMAMFFIPTIIGILSFSVKLSADMLVFLLFPMSAVLLGFLFVVGLAGFLNARGVGMAPQKTFGSVPGQFGVTIYRSNQPAIYEGIREIDLKVETPGSLYRGRQ